MLYVFLISLDSMCIPFPGWNVNSMNIGAFLLNSAGHILGARGLFLEWIKTPLSAATPPTFELLLFCGILPVPHEIFLPHVLSFWVSFPKWQSLTFIHVQFSSHSCSPPKGMKSFSYQTQFIDKIPFSPHSVPQSSPYIHLASQAYNGADSHFVKPQQI